ncbi:MAG: DUF4421 domain-containing protein [Bacteroidota bacterium]
MGIMQTTRIYFVLLLCVTLVLKSLPSYAQLKSKAISDTSYIQSYDTMITTRIFLTQKYLSMHLKDKNDVPILKFYPNSKLSLGLGASYGSLTINFSAGLGFLNNGAKEKEKPETKALDLQVHFYGPKLIMDVFAQHYKGFYLFPKGKAVLNNGENWYKRPDMILSQYGASGFYVLNWRKFSSRAAYLQNEWQIKSAGSFLLGAEVFYKEAKADSSFVPGVFNNIYQAAGVYRVRSGSIAPGAGYAYTLVLAKHFFISGSLTGGLSVNLLKETFAGAAGTRFGLNPTYAFKTGIGYNSRRFTTSITWVNNSVATSGDQAMYTSHSGIARVHLAYRLPASNNFKQKIRFLER